MGGSVQQFMTREVVAVGPRDTLGRARNLMMERGIKRLVVVDEEGRIEGVITTTDLVKDLSKGRAPWRWRKMENSLVRRYMTPNPITVSPSAEVDEAARMMLERGISGLPVTGEEELVGIITKTDLIRYFAEELKGRFKVRDLMTKNVLTVKQTDSIKKAAKIMAERGVNRLVISDSGRTILGIVTEVDLAYAEGVPSERRLVMDTRWGREVREAKAKTVGEVMKEPVVTVRPEDDASKSARMMIEFGFSGFPVSSDGEKLEGIITKTDIVRGIVLASEKGIS